ncbi:right-handed parallel beta-helix repeat-containing protein [Pontiella sulfatireligans]|uniref:Right handed beta helix domain-containing protein n=1 Tax=Pontiella sulfatireligans TaxID=2750658 RepID=A0A6C2UGM1_9BACT|nr:right-handed parallel beta-helix repeat-containing protein [Pontiella sulfatireligans]VGO19325.1 hypothetical protein SCARR_01383 [Pontiella sulfatireligans]
MKPFLYVSALLAVQAVAGEFYVSPTGNDDAAGSLATPFKTIDRARDMARSTKDHVTVYLRGGTYRINQSVVFGVADGNTSYMAYKNEKPVISSAVPVMGWEKHKGGLWVADIPEGVTDFKVMFDGNRMLERARSRGFQSPQQNFKKFATRNVALPEDRPLLRRLEFPEGEIEAWDNIEDVEAFFCGVPWTFNFSSIEKVDEEKNIAWLKYEGNTPPSTTPKPYNPSYIENHISVLDQPGEWCVNTRTRKIHYWPVNGTPGDEICVPTLVEFFRVEGDIDYDGPKDTPVKNITFKGLTFTQGDRYSWWDDHKGWGIQHDWDKFDCGNALLRFRGAEDCVVDQCRFINSGNSAVRLDLHAQNITVKNSLIDRVGHMGILLCGYGPGTKDVNKNNKIVNNLIRRTGELVLHGHAIFIWQSGENFVANNHIREVPRKAIGICGVRGAIFMEGKKVDWDEASKAMRWHELGADIFEDKDGTLQQRILPFLHARNNLIQDNYVYRARTKIGDGAALNVSGAGTGNVMRRNMLYMSLGNGMRCDDWQQGTTFDSNLILSGGVVHKGRNNLINNIFMNSNIRFSLFPGQQPDPGSEVKNNLFYFSREIAPYTGRQSNSINTPESCDLENNLYFCEAGNGYLEKFVAEKHAAGMDKGSVVADPKFAKKINWSADAQPEDYRLANDSPAVKMGFKPIDVSKIGLTDDYPSEFLGEVFPSKRGQLVSGKAIASSTGKGDINKIFQSSESMTTVFETKPENAPYVEIELDKKVPVDGLEIIADVKDRQNALRSLTVWTSNDRKNWVEIWRADPYHIAMGRDWMVNPYDVLPAKYVKIGLRPQAELQMTPEDERMKMGRNVLRLNRIRIYSK